MKKSSTSYPREVRLVPAANPNSDRGPPGNASSYLKGAGVALRPPGGRGRTSPSKPAKEVITDSAPKPAIKVITDSEELRPSRSPSSSACLPYREAIEVGLSQGRNA